MLEQSIVVGPIIVKATKVKDRDDEYYFEFQLTHGQKIQFIADLIIEHATQGTLHTDSDPNLKKMEFLYKVMNEQKGLGKEVKEIYVKEIARLSMLV